MLSLFSPTDEDIQNQVDYLPELQIATAHEVRRSSTGGKAAELPTIEVMKVTFEQRYLWCYLVL